MSKKLSVGEAAKELLKKDNFLIYMHNDPDGDTIGSGLGLCFALRKIGKNANVVCRDLLPEKYGYITNDYQDQSFKGETFVAVDTADLKLLSKDAEKINFDFCIDHHPSNKMYAKKILLVPTSPATCEIVFDLVGEMDIDIDENIGNCLFTGLSTDTGCFKYASVTAKTHRVAATLIESGAKAAFINKEMFDVKSRERLALETNAMKSLKYFSDGKIAAIWIREKDVIKYGIKDWELDGISTIPRKISGVMIGITLKERSENEIKVSVRTSEEIDASQLCKLFGGGGHARASGCLIKSDIKEATSRVVKEAKKMLSDIYE